jgi:hypothetical protein
MGNVQWAMGNRGKTTEYAEGQRFVEMDSMDRMQRMDGGSAKGGIRGVRSFWVVICEWVTRR